MKATGIVCEYNPFHNGHIHHIEQTKKICQPDVLVCVMSGNFVQRGEPAIIDKWERAKTAVENGVDLVIELPFLYATQSASFFAKGAIDTLKVARIDSLVFGSESNNISSLKALSQLDDTHYKEWQVNGLSSAKAYEQLYGVLNANDILAINYLKQLNNTNITPYSIQRTNNYHDEQLHSTISSATSIREALKRTQDISQSTCMENLCTTFYLENYYPLIKAMLLTTPRAVLATYLLMDEGIENNLVKHATSSPDFSSFLSACISKRYTKSRIQRTLIHLLCQTTKADADTMPTIDSVRVLAYNDTGKQYLKELQSAGVHVASRFNQIPEAFRTMELKAAHVYCFPLPIHTQNNWLKKEVQPPLYVATL